jgi:HEAT repeat protein
MTVTFDQVRNLLAADEPNYAAGVRWGTPILPHLQTLINSGDEDLGAKAASLAGFIDDDRAVDVLRQAANSTSPLVRLAAAGALRKMKRPAAAGVLMALLHDSDAGVRKLAVKSAATRDNSALLAKIDDISRRDPSAGIRSLASRVVSEGRRRRSA